MWLQKAIIISALTLYCYSHNLNIIDNEKFPDDFIFGIASSAYQTEGGWNEDGKGENIWDHLTHTQPERIKDKSNGDIACDSYHKLDEDIALLKQLGVNHYRFSLSWTRILPSGFTNKVNKAGIDYYNNLIDKLLANNILPMVTIYHWDLPQPLQILGGFANPLMVEWFETYARVVFEHFGDRVKFWTTFNEPKQICIYGYGSGSMAPGYKLSGVADYICNHHLIKAHARAYHLYDKYFRPKQQGLIGLVIECEWNEPASNKTEDIEAAERQTQFHCGLHAQPIYGKNGDYPEIVKEFVARRSKEEGYTHSRLPSFTLQEIKEIRGTYDYLGLNHYSTYLAANKKADPIGDPSWDKDIRVETWQDPSWPVGAVDPFRSVPWGLRKVLKWLKDAYNPLIYITENGFPDVPPVHDTGRIDYLVSYLKYLLRSIYDDEVQVKGYTAWSHLDYFEWFNGYTFGFGFHHVNFTDPSRPRTPKDSVEIYKGIIQNRKLPIN